jgi:hypothetical protein
MSLENPTHTGKLTKEELPAFKEHAEAMHIMAQEENGIEHPTSLEHDLIDPKFLAATLEHEKAMQAMAEEANPEITLVEDQEKLAAVQERLAEHAEAMHIMAQEENGIENPTALKEDTAKEVQESKKVSVDAKGHAKSGHIDMNSVKTWSVLGPLAAASVVGVGALIAKPLAVLGWLMRELFIITGFRELWSSVTGSIGKMMGGSGGGGAKPKKASGGGGGGAAAHH